jgi:hypothetical protein
MTIKLITFKTNHTIIGETDDEVTNKLFNTFKIKQPVQVVVQPTKEGPMMGFAPFLDFAEEFLTGIELCKDDVLCVTTPSRELQNQYSKVFGSGIEIASAIPKL